MSRTCSRPLCPTGSEGGPWCRKHRLMLQNAGVSGYIDATPARERVQALHSAGWSYYRIGTAAGIATATVQRIGRGLSRRAYAPTVTALASVRGGQGRWIDSTGTRRRIAALVRLGWTYQELSRRSGVPVDTLRKVCQRPRVNSANAAAVVALYDEIGLTLGPSRKAATQARVRGFPSPLAWDVDTIDDPDAKPDFGAERDVEPDEVLIERAATGKRKPGVALSHGERLAALALMVSMRLPVSTMGKRLGCGNPVVEALLAELDRGEVAA